MKYRFRVNINYEIKAINTLIIRLMSVDNNHSDILSAGKSISSLIIIRVVIKNLMKFLVSIVKRLSISSQSIFSDTKSDKIFLIYCPQKYCSKRMRKKEMI